MRARRVDANHGEIVSALRAIGAVVTDTSRVGEGFPDLVMSYRGRWHVLEIKDGSKAPSARALTTSQVQWTEKQRATVLVATSVAEAIDVITRSEEPF